jgi:polar amino acid transport system substrate-binding protein
VSVGAISACCITGTAMTLTRCFMTTVTQGRITKGMPNWSNILTDEQFKEILAFLHSVQEP